MTMFVITLTKHPERACGDLGISMYFGSPSNQNTQNNK